MSRQPVLDWFTRSQIKKNSKKLQTKEVQRSSNRWPENTAMERIEPRLLLSGETLSFIAGAAAANITLRIDDTATPTVQIIENSTGNVLMSHALADTTGVAITGSDQNDSVTIDKSAAWVVPITVDGGGGQDKLIGPAVDSTWNVTGPGSGSIGTLTFANIEDLLGGANNQDTFVFDAAGSISGVVDGGPGGFDSLVVDGVYNTLVFTPSGPNSGVVERDGDVISYDGLEPVAAGTATNVIFNGSALADNWILEDSVTAGKIEIRSTSGTIETTEFAIPTTLTINLLAGADTLAINSLGDSGFTGSVTVNAGDGDDVITVNAVTGGGVFTINGDNNNDTLNAAALTAGSSVVLNGGSGNDTLEGGRGDDTLTGGDGNDKYVFFNAFGNDTVTEAASDGKDTLDFSAVNTGLTVSADKATITTTGGTLIQSNPELAEEIDVTLTGTAKAAIIGALSDLSSIIDNAQSGATAITELVNALPFLGSLTGGTVPNVADLLQLSQTFQDLKSAFTTALNALGATPKLSQVVNALNAITPPALFTGGGNHLSFSTDYRKTASGSDPDSMEALIDMDMLGSSSQTIKLETGAEAKGAGININADVTANATLSGKLSLGFETSGLTPVAFIVPGRSLTLDVGASATITSAPLNLGILSLSITSGSISFDSHVDLALTDTADSDERITTDEVAGPFSNIVSVTTGVTTPFTASITVGVDPGVKVSGVDLSTKTVTANITLPGGIFGTSTGPSLPHFDISAPGVSLNDFGNVSLNDLLGMLGHVLDAMSGIGNNAVLNTAIPFTGKKISDIVNLAEGYKKTVFDPLFKTGDASIPDFNGDTFVDLNDLSFGSIQELAKALTAELGLGSLLDVNFDSGTNELTFAMNYSQSVGDASAVETTPGDGSHNEVQTLNVNAVASGGLLADTFRLAFPKADGTLEFTSAIALGAAGTVLQLALEGLSDIDPGDVSVGAKSTDSKGDHYAITFTGGTYGHKNVPLLVVDANQLALGIPLDFGASLGDIASVKTTGTAILAAGFSTGFTFGLNLNQSTKIEITPPTFTPDNSAGVTFETTTQGTTNLNEVQKIHVNNATGGTYKLSYNGNFTAADIAFNASAGTVEVALRSLAGLSPTNVSVTGGTLVGNDRTYTVTFQNGLAHTDALAIGADPTNLKGPAQNGILSATANFDAQLFYNPATGVVTKRQGDGTHNEQQTVTILNATGGTFTLAFNGHATADQAYGADATTIQTALEGLAGIGVGNVAVTKVGDVYTIDFQSALQHTNVAALVADGKNLVNTSAALTLTNITVAPDLTNTSPDDLRADVEAAINQKLIDSGLSLGFFTANLTAGGTFTAGHTPETTPLLTDLAFTLNPSQVTIATTQEGDGSHNEVETVNVRHATGGTFTLSFGGNTTSDISFNATAAAVKTALEGLASIGAGNVDVSLSGTTFTITFQGAKANLNVTQITTDYSKLTASVTGSVKRTAVTDAASLPTAIAAAINNALKQAGITEITVAGGLDGGGNITLTPTGGNLNVQFRSPFTVDAGGGRIAVDAASVTIAVDALAPSVNVDGRVHLQASFANPAYQEMGLLTSPTHFNGTTTNAIDLTLVVNGNKIVHVTLGTGTTSSNTSISDLVAQLQSVVDTELIAQSLAAGDVIVYLVDPLGNRIGFRGKEGVVTKLAMNVLDSATNGAITDLGYLAGNGETHSAKADGFFLENVHLTGNFEMAASGVTATASLGFLGITATGGGILGSNKFIDVHADISLKNPVSAIDPNRVTVTEIANSLKNGHFLFSDAAPGGTDDSPATGVVDATLGGGIGFHLTVTPTTPIGGISALNATLDLTATSPNWLTSLPSFADPLGFGTDSHALSGSPITLDTAVPSNGQLTDSITFVVTDGTHNGIVFVPAKDTSGFSSRTDLGNAIQTAVNAAMVAGSVSGTVVVAVDGSGKITMSGTGATLSVRGPIAFSGPDLNSIIDKFRNLSFDDILGALKFVLNFLHGLDGAGGAASSVLDFKLPLVDKSVSDILDVASSFADQLTAITNNPSGSIQDLNKFIDGLLGLSLSTNILSFDATNKVVGFDFELAKSVHLTRPFDLDLAAAGLPDTFTNLVSLSASGNLDLTASFDLALKLGLDLSGDTKSFFIKTGATGTGLHADITASGNALSFDAQIGPFGMFVIAGSASLNGHVDLTMHDDGDGRFDLVTLTGLTPTVTLPGVSDMVLDFPTTGNFNKGSVNLPLFLGTKDSPIPLDFAGAHPGTKNALAVTVDLKKLITGSGGEAFAFTLPDFDFANLAANPPGIFALLSDPAVTVDGLDRLLGTIQDSLNGQIMGNKLPLIGDALANNPASQFIGNMRTDVLQPLAKTIRENNLNLDGLTGFIQQTLFEVFGPSHLNILKDSGNGGGITKDDIKFTFLKADGTPTDIVLLAHALQIEMDLGKSFSIASPPIDLDLGIPALGIHAQLHPQITLAFDLKLGFGVDDKKGFYFVTNHDPELSVSLFADLGSTDATTNFDDANRAKLDAQLLFLALKVSDGVDLNNDGHITRGADTDGDGIPDDPNADEFSHIYFAASVNLDGGSDGKLTIPEMVSGSFSDIVKPSLVGSASLHAQAKVDFSSLGANLGNILPSISTDLLVDFGLSANPTDGFKVAAPQVILANVTLDLGSFVSSFAGPILEEIHKILEPFDWLIGPDGFLNKRIPLLSDLAGHKITGKDLVVLFDPDDGPAVVAVLDFVEQLDYLSGLVSDAASGGVGVGINFGDLVLFDSPDIGNFGGSFTDHPINIGSGGGGTVTDPRNLDNFKNVLKNLPSADDLKNAMSTQGAPSAATSSFTSGVTESASIDFAILKPENIFKLILGQPDVTLVTVQLPKFGFNFLYQQQFPIIGPLVGTFAGGIGGGIDMGFGYDTRGLSEFISTHNPADLIDGFFLTDLNSAGVDKPEAFLTAQIRVGAAISLGVASAGVEGGIQATIDFNFDDLDGDGKIRINELEALLAANDFNPLAVFDVSGKIDLFMDAYVEFLFFKAEFEFARITLFSFDVTPTKPPMMGSMNGDTLTLNLGPNAASRLNGDTSDGNEHLVVGMDGSDVVISSFTVNGVDQSPVEVKGFGRFSGVHKIIVDGGAGDDVIDLSGVSSSIAVTMHGGAGNDVLTGGQGDDTIYGDAGDDEIHGGGGNDTISGGDGNDTIFGDAGNDIIVGDAGDDTIHGGANDDTISGGPGDDHLFGDTGANVYLTSDFGSIETIDATGGSDTLDFTSKPQALAIFLTSSDIEIGMTPHVTHAPAPDPLDPDGPQVSADPILSDFDSQLTVTGIDGIKKIIGSDFADTFFVHQTTASSEIELDGGKGSDRYIFIGGTAHVDANVHDTGNPWDSADTIEIRGTLAADTMTVTNAHITLSATQNVDYVAPTADASVLQIKVFGKGGDDTLNLDSTAETVPVRMDGGGGNDLFTVGKGTLNNIVGLARTGLNSPFGLGPVVLVGGAGQDSVLITDEADTGANIGNLTAFTETRLGVVGTTQVGVVSGLGMVLHGGVGINTVTDGDGSHNEVQEIHVDDAISGTYQLSVGGVSTSDIAIAATASDIQTALSGLSTIGGGNVAVTLTVTGTHRVYTVTFQNGKGNQNLDSLLADSTNLSTAGRVEFEGFETVDVRLGKGNDAFTIGGDAVKDDLPQNRQSKVQSFVNTITGMTIVEGGGGDDTIGVIATNTLDRSTLLTTAPGPLVTVATTTPGVDGTTSEVETITVKSAGRGVGFFTIQYRYAESRPIAFGASASEVQDALVSIPLIGSNASGAPNVSVTKGLVGGNDVYTITFQNDLQKQDILQLTPMIAPLTITGDTSGIGTKYTTATQGKAPSTNEVQNIAIRGVTGLTTFTLTFESGDDSAVTSELTYGASAAVVQAALEALSLIGAGNVTVSKATVDGADIYTVTFQGALAHKDVAQLLASIVQDGADTINVQSIREDTFVLGGGGDDVIHLNVDAITGIPITGNGVNAKITLDGQDGSDTYDIRLVGGTTASLINVFDAGSAFNGFDVLTVTGTDLPDRFLLRAAASQSGLAFIAMLNQDGTKSAALQPVERVNYNINLEKITVNSLGGDDEFYIDDTRAQITINAGDGNDFFQVGQLYQTERTFGDPDNSTNIAEADAYATIETTKGFLSNGVSFPITINGDAGEDLFIVFHNLAVANLNGGDGDDTFIIQAFALAGSTEDHRALTDLSGDAGADFIQYAVDAPVNINGGDGFDTVIVIGTEFSDDFVITAHGIFGAGLNVNYINVELLQVDGAEGDDRFFVLGTSPDVITEISGGLGTDLMSINGPTPANGVISNNLLGHNGILTHTVTSSDPNYDGLKVIGISANVADNDEPAVIVTQTDGASMVVQGTLPTSGSVGARYQAGLDSHVIDSYSIVLSRPPVNGSQVVISIDPPPGLVFVSDDGTNLFEKRKGPVSNGNNPGGVADGLTITFSGSDWYVPRKIYFKVDASISNIPDLGDLNHKVVAVDSGGHTVPEITGSATGGGGNGSPVVVATTTPGSGLTSEVQTVTVAHTSGFGYFALTFRDAETDPLPFGASAADVEAALAALPLIGLNAANLPDVHVTGGPGTYTITFQNDLANQDVSLIKGRELSTLIDTSLPAALRPGGAEGLPEGLRGAFITIVDSVSRPQIVGQTRLILFQDSVTGSTLIVNKPWDLHGFSGLPTDARYEIKLYAGLSVPNVRVQIYTQQTPALVVVQTEGSTSVGEISTSTAPSELLTELTNKQADEIDVRLSKMPTSSVTVMLGNGNGQLQFFDKDNLAGGAITSLTFTTINWNTFRHILVRGNDDLIVEGFHKADLTLTASGGGYDGISKLIVADITDNDAPGVRIIESNGSTDVIEFSGGDFGVSQATADTAGFPYSDSYQVELTSAPTSTVTVNLLSNPTRTSRTGGIRSFVEQLEISTDGISWGLTASLTFTTGDWNAPKKVFVRAKNDTRVDGGDTRVFPPLLDQLNSIQGPLFLSGAPGSDKTGLTEREPIMLPGERDEKHEMGNVVAATEASGTGEATITINPSDIDSTEIDALNNQPNASVTIVGPLTNPNQLRNVSIQITHGPGKNKVRIITGGTNNGNGTWTLTLGHEWFSPFPAPGNSEIPDSTGKYVLMQTNPNLLVTETDQTDILQVHDTDNINSYDDPNAPGGVNPFAVGQLFFDSSPFGSKATVTTVTNGGPKAGGAPAVDEVQKLVLAATGGTFKLVFSGHTTSAIAYNATAAAIQSALEALSNIGSGHVLVTKPSTDPVFMIEFQGTLGLTDQPRLDVDSSGLTGGTPLNEFRVTGLGMGGTGTDFDRTIGTGFSARVEPGGLTLADFEDIEIDLGPGNDHFTIFDTPEGVQTTLNAGAGKDLVDVKAVSGHTFVNLGAGSDALHRIGVTAGDIINIHNDVQTLADISGLLTISGDIAQATIVRLAKGSPVQGGGLVAAVNEIQQITVDATGGTFSLSLTNPATLTTATTGALPYNVTAAAMQAALQGLSTIGAGNVAVTKAGNVYRVSFMGALAAKPVVLLVAHEGGLTNGLGETDVMNVVDSGNTAQSVGVLTSSSLTGLSTSQINEIQTIVVDATQGHFTVSFNGHASASLDFNISAAALQAVLESLPGTPIKPGDVAVTKDDDVYVIRFQGNLTNADVAQIVATNVDLQKRIEPSGGDPNAAPSAATAIAGDPILVGGSVTVSTRVQGQSDPKINDEFALTVNATAGTFTLTLLSGTPQQFTTLPIAFDASAELLRQTIQNAAAAAIAPGDTFEPQKFDVWVSKYENVYIIGFQGKLRQFNSGPGVDFLKVNSSGLTGTANVATRMDGLNYYGVEQLNIDLGSSNDMFNVQGTSAGSRGFANGGGVAVTNVRMHDGNEQAFVSSNADLDFNSAVGFDFLTGNLDDVRGALNLDFGSGRHKLMISDEAATVGDPNVVITDVRNAATQPGLDPNAEIWITGLAPAGISYQAGTSANRSLGNFFDGILYWTGSGNDTIKIDGTINRSGSGQRTMTLLNTGLGNDNVTVTLNGALNQPTGDTGQDGFFALNTMGGSASPIPTALPGGVTDNDTVDASLSTLPMVIFGGLGNDSITGGTNNDIIFGDDGRVQYANPASPNTLLAVVGFGGRGDLISSQVLYPIWMMSRDNTLGGADTIHGLAGEDLLIGGAAGDSIDGGTNDDLIFGDDVKLSRRPTIITNPRFETLIGGQIYSTTASTVTTLVDGTAQTYRDPDGSFVPSLAKLVIHNLYHTLTIQSANDNSFGNDYIAGGAGSDVIFGQLGNDTIQGDGSIDATVPGSATDGDDYIEGGGGNDVIIGGLGQDDIIGGSSDLFTLNTPDKRPDGSDIIFGGDANHAGRLDDGTLTGVAANSLHGRDSDTILGDNGDIFRLVGINHVALASGFLSYNYDNYGGTKIIPRAVRLLDYTLGGPTFSAAALLDIGAADEIHGESGDDFIYGMKGDDIIFGDGQDDNIIGGYGNDWISGGNGQDGILGDDGLIYTSRNGLTEPLNGILTATTQQTISTPGNMQSAIINTTGQLNKAMELVPFSFDPTWNGMDDEFPDNADPVPFADDIIFGGLGSDFIHGGSGDDAISGAEALDHAWVATYDVNGNVTGMLDLGFSAVGVLKDVNPGNVLAFNPMDINGQHLSNRFRAGEFALYDEYDPLRMVQLDSTGNLWKSSAQGTAYNFLLNFNKDEGVLSGTVHDDGSDAIFGDNGNDWIVGGTGRDDMYGGWGNDLINADDDQTTNGSLNDQPDTDASYEDRAFGGAGRDVLIANTGGDRLIDWVGEYNSYLVPFAPFGAATVSRTLQPALPEFLYALSKADGADQSQTRDTGESALRNGEPEAELGVVLQKDFAWKDQTGAPSDPQAGNIPGGKRDVLRSADFNNGQTQAFFVDTGTFAVSGGRYQVSPSTPNGDATAVFDVDAYIPNYFEMTATVNAAKPTGGSASNGYLIFDYQSATDFKFAGIDVATNKLEIGHRNAQGWYYDTWGSVQAGLKSNTDYNIFLSINGSAVVMTVNNQFTLSFTFAARVDALGVSHGINDGLVGLGAHNSTAAIDNVVVQRAAPFTTLSTTVDFNNGSTTSLFSAPVSGTWQVLSGRDAGTAGTNPAIELVSFNVQASSMIDLTATFKTSGEGGFVYDMYAVNDFKFVSISAGKITMGHRTAKGWFTDATVSNSSILANTDYTLELVLKGTTVSVNLNGQTVVSRVYNAVVTDGSFGLLSRTGTTSFDTVTVKSDDPGLLNKSFALTAASSYQGTTLVSNSLTEDEISLVAREAVREWVAAAGKGTTGILSDLHFVLVSDLPGDGIAWSIGDNTILIDVNAAGYGWFVDTTPWESSEFHAGDGVLVANTGSGADGHMDLLTAVMHEIGHILGYEHTGDGLMAETLAAGQRKLEDAPQAGIEAPIDSTGHSGSSRSVTEKLEFNWNADILAVVGLGWNESGQRKKSAWFPDFDLENAGPPAGSREPDQIEWYVEK